MRLVGIEHLVGHGLGMVQRHDYRTERNAVEAVGEEEDPHLDIFEQEVGTQHLLVEGVFLLAELLGVIPPVPRGEFTLGDILAEELLHLGEFALGAFEGRFPHLVEQCIDGVGGTGHLVVDHIRGIRRVAQQVCLLRAQTDEVVDQLFVVVFVAVVAAVQIGLVKLLAAVTAGGVGQEGNQARLLQREGIPILLAQFGGRLAGQITHVCGQAVQLIRRKHHHEVVVLRTDVVAEVHGGQRQRLVDLLQTGLPFGIEQRPGTHEAAVGLLHQPQLLGIEIHRRAAVVDRLDTFEELPVEPDTVGMSRQQRRRLHLELLQFGGVLRGAEHLEDQLHLGEHLPGVVVGENRVFERGFVVVRGDGVDFGVMERHAALQGGQEVFGGDPVEGGHAVGGLPLGEEGILAHLLLGFATNECHGQKKRQ